MPSSSRQCRSRPRRSSTSCHGGMLRQRRLPLGPDLRLLVAVDALLRPPELLRPMLKRKLGRRVEPLAGARRPPRPIRAPSRPGSRRSGPYAGNPEMLEFALSQETTRTASLLPPVENLMFPFISVPPLAQGSVAPTYSKKEQFPFPPGFQVHGSTVCDALPPHSRPRPILPAAKRARFGDAVPPHAPLASPLWDPGSSAWMLQNALPSVPSSSTPLRCTTAGTSIVPLEPLARRLEAWLALPSPSRWLTRTIRLGCAIQFARRPPKFSGVLETSVEARNAPVLREEIAVLLAKDAIEPVPPAEMRQGFYSPYFIVPKKGGGLRPILDLRLLNRALHRFPFKMLTHRRMIKCIQPRDWFAAIDLKDAYFHVSILPRHRPFLRFAFEGRAWQYRVLPFGLSLSPRVFTKVVEGALAPLREVGVRILNYLDDWLILAQSREQLCDLVLRHLSQLGLRVNWEKSKLSPAHRIRVSPHGRARPISAELPEFLRRQDCGSTETVSEAPGAYGIRSCGHAARIASYETTSALVALPSPEVGMAPRCTSGEHHTGVSPLLQPLDGPCLSTGRGALPRRMATPSRDDPADLESIRGSSGRPVCFPRVLPLPAVFLPDRGHPRHGRIGTQLASGSIQVCISPSEPARTDTVQGQGGRGAGPAGRAVLAHPDLVSRTHSPRDSPSLAHSSEEGPPFSGARHHLAPASRPVEPPCVAPGRDASDLSGLPQAVVETITQARAPSTRQAYALKWSLFANWCSSRREDPRRCTIGVVLSFLQERLERRLSPSTLKVYVAAIAAHHDAVDGRSLGKHDLIVRFLRGARRLNPSRPPLMPSWDLSIVLAGLQRGPFELLDSVELKYLSAKTALLTALTSIKRVGDLQAFSVSEECLVFGPDYSHVVLRPRPGYVPKVPTTPFRDQVVNLQALPSEEADPALALLCPVRALRIYVDRTRSFRSSEQLFVCYGGQQKGKAVSKQRLAHWIVDAIALAYQSQGEPCPMGVRAHSTRSVASSYALAHGASLADICRAAGWATPNTFARFYSLRIEPVSSRVLGNR